MIFGLMKNLPTEGRGDSPTITSISDVDMGLGNEDDKGCTANPIHIRIFGAIVELRLFLFDDLELFLTIFAQEQIINFKKCFA